MDLVTPGIGLVFWTSITFVILLFLLTKLAWKPVLNMVKEREANIEKSLQAAEKAKRDLRDIQSTNEKLLADSRAERDLLLKEARDIKEKLISEAKGKATAEAEKILTAARETINNEKNAAIIELKNQVATLSIEIAEKILRSELSSDAKQSALASKMMEEVKMN